MKDENKLSAINISTVISTIYIGIATGILLYIFQVNEITLDTLTIVFIFLSTIIFHIFSSEFLLLSVWHENVRNKFAWYGSFCYGIGQTLFFIGVSLIIEKKYSRYLSFYFLVSIIFFWIVYYYLRLKYIPEEDFIIQRWFTRGLIFIMYISAIMFLIFS